MNHSPLLPTQQTLAGSSLKLTPALDGAWELPASYAPHGASAEYAAVTAPGGAGLVDRAWRAALHLRGRDRGTFLQGMVSNDIVALQAGQGCRAMLLDSTGHILAEVVVHALADALLVETDPRCVERLAQTLDKYLIMEKVAISDVSSEWAILSMQGEGANAALSGLLGTPLPDLPPLGNVLVTFESANSYVVANPHSRVLGYDLWLPTDIAPLAWERLVSAGVAPVGEEAAEMLRVEAGIPAWGHELNETVLLPEADLPDVVSYTKGCYVGQEIIARLRARGHANRALRGVLLTDDAATPKSGDTLHAPEDSAEAGREIGRITSAVASPLFGGRPLALGYVRREYFENGTPVDVHLAQPDGTVFRAPATVLTRPFGEG